MDVRQLKYFLSVVDNGSFSKAANKLHVAQPALSQHVRHMEQELGVMLLHRCAQGVNPTEAGDRLIVHARRIVAEFAEIGDNVRGSAETLQGIVRFGLPGTVSELLAVPLIESAKARYPEVRIRVVEAMSGYILDWLKRGEVDLAMIYSTTDPKGLTFHHGLSEEIYLFASPDLAKRNAHQGVCMGLDAAADLPLIVPGRSHGLREVIDTAALSVGVAIQPAIEIDSYSQIKKLVSRGIGYGILPRVAVEKEAKAGMFRLWRFARPAVTRNVYLAYSTDRPLFNAQRAIAQLSWDILRQLVRERIWTAQLTDESHRPSLYV